MKVVFLEDVPGTAKIGEIKDVKPGFARNYLLPRRIAMPATTAVVKTAEARAVREARLQEARDHEARTVAEKVNAATISISARAGSSGKLFGSVGTADIAGKVGEIIRQEIDRHNVLLPEPIKDLGDYEVAVRLTRNVTATAHVSVIGEDGTTAADIRKRTEAEKPAAVQESPVPEDSASEEEDADELVDDSVDEE